MGFLMTCGNKGCGKTMEPVLDVQSNTVYCTNCNCQMNGITEFAKNQMRFMGQTKKEGSRHKLFGFVCPYCNKRSFPKIVAKRVVCELCDQDVESKISPQIIHGIKQTLK